MGKDKAGRPRKYQSAETLATAVNAYFESISKKNGEFRKPPSLAGLCLYLGISRQTMWNYAHGESTGMAFVVQSAKLVIEDFWSGQLAGKFANGAKFALGSGFGWNEAGRWSERDREEVHEEAGGIIEIAEVRPGDQPESEGSGSDRAANGSMTAQADADG